MLGASQALIPAGGALPTPIRRCLTSFFMASVDEDEAVEIPKDTSSTWNLPGLKKEVQRLVLRCHKKLGKASQRLQQAQATVEELKPEIEKIAAEAEKAAKK